MRRNPIHSASGDAACGLVQSVPRAKNYTKAHLLEAKANLLRLRQDIPLADAELSKMNLLRTNSR